MLLCIISLGHFYALGWNIKLYSGGFNRTSIALVVLLFVLTIPTSLFMALFSFILISDAFYLFLFAVAPFMSLAPLIAYYKKFVKNELSYEPIPEQLLKAGVKFLILTTILIATGWFLGYKPSDTSLRSTEFSLSKCHGKVHVDTYINDGLMAKDIVCSIYKYKKANDKFPDSFDSLRPYAYADYIFEHLSNEFEIVLSDEIPKKQGVINIMGDDESIRGCIIVQNSNKKKWPYCATGRYP
jgi:hypothetical protein